MNKRNERSSVGWAQPNADLASGIAAVATNNVSEFSRVPALVVEDWLSPRSSLQPR